MTVTVEDVRFFLKNLPEDFVSDETIELQIDLSSWEVDKEKSSQSSDEDLDKCVLLKSAYYTTLAYLQEAERALGVVPPGLAALVAELKQRTEQAVTYIQRGNVFSISLSIAGLSDSMWSYTQVSTIKTCTAHNSNN